MASIVSSGIGSGLDINSIVSDLVAAQRQPQIQRLDRLESSYQSRLSGLGTLRGALSSLQDSLTNLNRVQTFRGRSATVADSEVLSASAGTAAAAGSYDISVDALARSHKLTTDPAGSSNAGFTSLSDVVGTGTLTFRFGTTDYDTGTGSYNSFTQNPDAETHTIEITDGSLSGIRDAINQAEIGVNASIIFDGSHYRLTLNGAATGAANSMEIGVDDSDANSTDDSGLSLLAFNADANHLTQTQAASDTDGLVVNGIAISSPDNTLVNVVEGLSINLTAPGSTTVTVEQDREGAAEAIRGFVDSFNSMISTINQLSSFDPETGEAGPLNGDSLLQSVEFQVRSILNRTIGSDDGSFRHLAEIGITRSVGDGTLVIDEARLQAAMDQDFDAIAGLFANLGRPSDSQISYLTAGPDTVPGNYAVNVTQLATRGALTGSTAAGLDIQAGVNDALNISVDGIDTTITLGAGSYASTAELAAELQARINGSDATRNAGVSVQVEADGGVLAITSDSFGSSSEVTVTGVGAGNLLGTAPVATAGLDVAGTIGGVAATGSGRTLIGAGDAEGLRLLVSGGTTGSRGVVSFTRGYADGLNRMLDGMLDFNGTFASVTDGIDRSIADINEQRAQVELRSQSYEERIRAQFTAMDNLVAQLQSTGNSLMQQLNSLPQIGQNSDG